MRQHTCSVPRHLRIGAPNNGLVLAANRFVMSVDMDLRWNKVSCLDVFIVYVCFGIVSSQINSEILHLK